MKKLNTTLLFFFLFAFSLFSFAQESISLLTFNVWNEGIGIPKSLTKIRDVIQTTDADIVGFAEVRNYGGRDWTKKIVATLNKNGATYYGKYIGGDVSIISKFPIIHSKLIYKGEGSVALFEIETKQQTIVLAMAHLDYTKEACYLPRGYNGGTPNWKMIDDGSGNALPNKNVKEILDYNLSSTRDEQIQTFLDAVKDETRPIILMGDFNEPSHLDWTESTAKMFDHNGLTIPWNNTLTLENNGFTDAYREFFPNPKINPGFTWPSFVTGKKSTSWTPKADERDRIDYIFYKNGVKNTSYAALVGPKNSYAYDTLTNSFTENENFIGENLEWPTDHKAVFVKLQLKFPINK